MDAEGGITVPVTDEGKAEFYGVEVRSITRWRADGAPLNDPKAMRTWVGKKQRVPKSFWSRMREIFPPTPGESDPDWDEFEQQVRTEDPKEALAKIVKARDWAFFKFEKAGKANNQEDAKFYSDILVKMEGALHDAQLRAKKLGIDSGELLPRPEVERMVAGLGYWMMRSVDQHLTAISTKLAKLCPSVSAEDVRAVLEPELISHRWLLPFALASKVQHGTSLPDWLVAKMRETAGDYLDEHGESDFDAARKSADAGP